MGGCACEAGVETPVCIRLKGENVCACACVCMHVCMCVHIEERREGGCACEAGVETLVCICVKGEGGCACACVCALRNTCVHVLLYAQASVSENHSTPWQEISQNQTPLLSIVNEATREQRAMTLEGLGQELGLKNCYRHFYSNPSLQIKLSHTHDCQRFIFTEPQNFPEANGRRIYPLILRTSSVA